VSSVYNRSWDDVIVVPASGKPGRSAPVRLKRAVSHGWSNAERVDPLMRGNESCDLAGCADDFRNWFETAA